MVKTAPGTNGYLRDARGRFLPGNSEASKKRGKKYAQTSAIARRYSLMALNALMEVAADPKSKPKTRALAAKTLLNYGWGQTPIDIVGLAEAATLLLSRIHVQKVIGRAQDEKLERLVKLLLMLNPNDFDKLLTLVEDPAPIKQLDERLRKI